MDICEQQAAETCKDEGTEGLMSIWRDFGIVKRDWFTFSDWAEMVTLRRLNRTFSHGRIECTHPHGQRGLDRTSVFLDVVSQSKSYVASQRPRNRFPLYYANNLNLSVYIYVSTNEISAGFKWNATNWRNNFLWLFSL